MKICQYKSSRIYTKKNEPNLENIFVEYVFWSPNGKRSFIRSLPLNVLRAKIRKKCKNALTFLGGQTSIKNYENRIQEF